MNLSEYRLDDLSHLEPFKEQMGEEKYFKYAISVYKQLARLAPGERFNIPRYVRSKNQELFIKIACAYMVDFPGTAVFNDDFTEIYKNADI